MTDKHQYTVVTYLDPEKCVAVQCYGLFDSEGAAAAYVDTATIKQPDGSYAKFKHFKIVPLHTL